jgi:hypothetical protein
MADVENRECNPLHGCSDDTDAGAALDTDHNRDDPARRERAGRIVNAAATTIGSRDVAQGVRIDAAGLSRRTARGEPVLDGVSFSGHTG